MRMHDTTVLCLRIRVNTKTPVIRGPSVPHDPTDMQQTVCSWIRPDGNHVKPGHDDLHLRLKKMEQGMSGTPPMPDTLWKSEDIIYPLDPDNPLSGPRGAGIFTVRQARELPSIGFEEVCVRPPDPYARMPPEWRKPSGDPVETMLAPVQAPREHYGGREVTQAHLAVSRWRLPAGNCMPPSPFANAPQIWDFSHPTRKQLGFVIKDMVRILQAVNYHSFEHDLRGTDVGGERRPWVTREASTEAHEWRDYYTPAEMDEMHQDPYLNNVDIESICLRGEAPV